MLHELKVAFFSCAGRGNDLARFLQSTVEWGAVVDGEISVFEWMLKLPLVNEPRHLKGGAHD